MAQAIITPSRRLIVGPRGVRKPARPVIDLTDWRNRSIVDFWPLGDIAGNVVTRNLIPGGHVLTGSSSPGLGASHHGGLAATFNGAANYTIPSVTLTNPFCFGLWVYESTRVNGGGDGAHGNMLFHFNANFCEASIDNGVVVFAGSAGSWTSTGYTLPLQTWTHLLFSSTSSSLTLFVNGVQKYTTGSDHFVNLTTVNVHLGVWGDGTNGPFHGSLESFAIAKSPNALLNRFAEPYAGIYEAGPRWRVGVAAAGGATRPVKMVGRWGGYAGASGGFAA